MPQPAEVAESAARLRALYAETQESLVRQLADAALSDSARGRLRALVAEVDAQLDALRRGTVGWLQSELPAVYSLGATAGAEALGVGWGWTQIHVEAVQALASTVWADIGASLQGVATESHRAIRDLLRDSTRRQILEGIPGRRASTEFLAELRARTGMASVRYRDGSLHALADYADSASRTTAANAYNAGTITLSQDEGVTWMECFDGAGCGLTSHQDSQKANGLVLPIETAASYPLSHPRCSRSWAPAPLVTTAAQAEQARRFTAEEQAAMAAEEEERATRALVQGQRPGHFSRERTERRERTARV